MEVPGPATELVPQRQSESHQCPELQQGHCYFLSLLSHQGTPEFYTAVLMEALRFQLFKKPLGD